MKNSDKLVAELHAKTSSFRRKMDSTIGMVKDALARMERPYIAFSAGKDSTVVRHLVLTQCSNCATVWSDDEWNLPETMTLVDAIPNLIRIAAKVQHAEWFTAWDEDRRPGTGTVWVDAPANNGLQTFAKQNQYDGVFIGLRADENARRKIHLRTHGPLFWAQADEIWQCNPIAWWTVMDVWAYIVSRNVPYNAAYDRLSEIGIPLESQRIGPFAVGRVLGYGQLSILKRGWPDLFNRFVEKYPEATAYV